MKRGWGFGLRSLAAVGLGLALASSAFAAQDAPPVTTELFADGSAVVPGKPFKVGVLFHVAPEFHIYWKNPGDAGLATSVKFELPEGFKVGELEWPLPQQFVQPGNIIGYGYEGTVLLTAEVTPPATLEIGQAAALGAKVSWLGCHKQCIPGKAELSAKLPVAQQSEPAHKELFAEWAARTPRSFRTLPEISGPVRTALIPGNRIMITWKAKPEKVEFFPAPPEGVLVDKVKINTTEEQTIISFAARRTGAAGPAEFVECIVAYTLPDGARKGFPVSLPLPAMSASPAAK